MHHPRACPTRAGALVLEERQVGARVTVLVRVEQVVDGRVVLVDRLLDEPQPEQADVEVDVALRVAGDAGHVVDAFELHGTSVGCAPHPESVRSDAMSRGLTLLLLTEAAAG